MAPASASPLKGRSPASKFTRANLAILWTYKYSIQNLLSFFQIKYMQMLLVFILIRLQRLPLLVYTATSTALSKSQAPGTIQWMALFSQQLCVGYPAGFMRYSLHGETLPVSLLHPDDPTLAFIKADNLDALCAVEISNKEMLLCFSKIAVYVDTHGRRSRQQELMWPATPTAGCE